MDGFAQVAIVNLMEGYYKRDYAVALYDEDADLIKKLETEKKIYVVVDIKGKNNKELGILQEVKPIEQYSGKPITAQVVGVVNMNAYNARMDEQDRLKKIKKQKATIEKQLKSEIEKLSNMTMYERVAKENPENPKLTELVNALKELGE